MSTSEKKIGLAVCGFGGMGNWHAGLVKDHDAVELKGVYDILEKQRQWAASQGYPTYDSFDALLSDPEVQLVLVAIPNDQHKPICIQAMAAGKNVVCEKPVTLSSADLQEMIDASKKYGVLFTVHQNRRWDEDFLVMKKIYQDGSLGKVFNIESRVHGSRGIPGDWRNQKAHGGGMVLDWGVHLFDQVFQMIDSKVKSLYAELTYVTNEECDDGFHVTVHFENGVRFFIEVGTSNFIELPRWYMLGENGSAILNGWEPDDGKITMVSDWEKRDAVPVVTAAGLTKTMAPRTDETIKEYPLPAVHADIRDYYRNVAKAIRGEEEQIVTHKQMMRVMKFMEAVFESAEKNVVLKDLDI